MYKLSITNNKNGRTFGATFKTQEEANTWRDSCIAKQSWGKNAHSIRLSVDETPKEGYASSAICVLQETIYDEETGEVTQDSIPGVEYFYETEYTIVEEDLSQNAEYVLAQKLQARKNEYAKIDDLLKEALVEKELGNTTKWSQYLLLRAAIKSENPL